MTIRASRGGTRSLEHLVPSAAPVSSRRVQEPAARYRPVLHHAVEYGSSGQSAIISGYQLAAILETISPAKAAALPNPHRRLSA